MWVLHALAIFIHLDIRKRWSTPEVSEPMLAPVFRISFRRGIYLYHLATAERSGNSGDGNGETELS